MDSFNILPALLWTAWVIFGLPISLARQFKNLTGMEFLFAELDRLELELGNLIFLMALL